MTARAAKKAETISQIVELEKPDRAAAIRSPASPSGARTPVAAQAAMAMIDSAPMGAALTMIPTMVARKIANRRQAWGSRPDGVGMSQTTAPTARQTASAHGLVSRPRPGRSGSGAADGPRGLRPPSAGAGSDCPPGCGARASMAATAPVTAVLAASSALI